MSIPDQLIAVAEAVGTSPLVPSDCRAAHPRHSLPHDNHFSRGSYFLWSYGAEFRVLVWIHGWGVYV